MPTLLELDVIVEAVVTASAVVREGIHFKSRGEMEKFTPYIWAQKSFYPYSSRFSIAEVQTLLYLTVVKKRGLLLLLRSSLQLLPLTISLVEEKEMSNRAKTTAFIL